MKRGDVQFTCAGSGIQHSEFNAHASEPVHFLQIWVKPNQKGLKPYYSTKHYSEEEKTNKLCLIVSPQGPIKINQDAYTFASILTQGSSVEYNVKKDRKVYIHLAMTHNDVSLKLNNDKELKAGDGAFIVPSSSQDFTLKIEGNSSVNAEFVLFDVKKE